MGDTAIDQLKAVNRELATFLKDQLEAFLTVRQSVIAMEKFLGDNPSLAEGYKACLQRVVADGSGLPNSQWTNRALGQLARIALNGTL
jgi:hypothetical protein